MTLDGDDAVRFTNTLPNPRALAYWAHWQRFDALTWAVLGVVVVLDETTGGAIAAQLAVAVAAVEPALRTLVDAGLVEPRASKLTDDRQLLVEIPAERGTAVHLRLRSAARVSRRVGGVARLAFARAATRSTISRGGTRAMTS